jgi:small-conductance mechanosensitive channel
MDVFGVRIMGISAENGRKLLLSLALIAVVTVLRIVLRRLLRSGRGPADRDDGSARGRFWAGQTVSLAAALVLVGGLVAIWFDDPGRFATGAGLVTAGVAVALQRVITSFAAYLIILRGRVFTVGDRVTFSGVRGDVVALGFMQTSVMEMGETPPMQSNDPAVWVQARQYTGRIVRISNDRIFDAPVYNYTREFPFLWEEMRLPVDYSADDARAESILLEAARRHTSEIASEARAALDALQRRYFLAESPDLEPRVYMRLTDNWVELTLRFVTRERGARGIKDAISREIRAELRRHGMGVASTTVAVVGLPPITIARNDATESPGA